MAVAVDIFVKDDSAIPGVITGVVVGVFDSVTFAPVAQAVTDGTGKASFLLPGSALPGTVYEVRFFKLGVFFPNPVQIAVLDPVVPPASNIFDFSGTLVGTLPVATDPRVCRCTGRFMNYSNRPIANTVFRVFADQSQPGFEVPLVVDGNLVASQAMDFKTDDDGYVTVDLLRGGQYRVMFPSQEEKIWCIDVPDRSSVNLIDLIFPYPVSLSWDPSVAPGDAVTVTVGQMLEVPFSVIFSNYLTISKGIQQWLTFTNSDDTKMSVAVSDSGMVIITGVAAGSAQVTGVNRSDLNPSRVPTYSTLVPPLTVTVSP